MKQTRNFDGDDRPVFDNSVLGAIIGGIGVERAQSFIDRTIASAEGALQEFSTNNGDARECEQIAHRLKGTAANIGLARIALAAGEIEDLARRDAPIAALELQPLRAAIDVTRLGLARWLQEGPTDEGPAPSPPLDRLGE